MMATGEVDVVMWMTKVPTSVFTVASSTEFAAMHIGGALVKAITRFTAPAAVVGGQTGAIAAAAVVVVVLATVVVVVVAGGFLVLPLDKITIRAMMIPTTTITEMDRRPSRRLFARRS